MAETTGHYYDSGSGPTPLRVASGQTMEAAEQQAYRAYVDHRPVCPACQAPDVFQCADAAALWEAYRAARAEC